MLTLIYCIEIHLLNQIFEFQPSHNRRQLLLTLQVKQNVIYFHSVKINMKPLIILGYFFSAQQSGLGSFGIGFSPDYFGNICPADYQVIFKFFSLKLYLYFIIKRMSMGLNIDLQITK